jgi:two-component system sporulation sensor kinase A
MVVKDFFINISVFSFLFSAVIFLRVFVIKKTFKAERLYGGLFAGLIAAVLMLFHFKHEGYTCDIRIVPLILSFIYFGRRAGWMTLSFIVITRVLYIGDNWAPSVIAYLVIAFLFTLFNTCFKNLPPFKGAFIYMAVYTVILHIVFRAFSINLPFDAQSLFFISAGLLIGIFLIESYQKLYRLSEELSKMNFKLAESKQELKDMVHGLQGGIFKFKKVNERFIYTLFDGQFFYRNGYSTEDKPEKDLQTLSPPHLFPRLLEYFQEAWNGQVVTFETPWPDDETIILISLRPIKYEGKVMEVVGTIVDVTERKNIEEELSSTKERLESFIEHNMDSISMIDLEGHVLQVNKAFEEIFGWSEQEIIGKRFPTIPNIILGQTKQLYQRVISGESITGFETVRLCKDERFIDVSLTLSPILDMNGNVIALSAIIRDITQKKKTERELLRLHLQLQESEMKYRTLFEQAADAVYLVELNKEDRMPERFIEVNPVGCERFGYSRENLLSMSFYDIVSRNSNMLINITEKIREGKHRFTVQDEYVFKTGKKMNTEFSVHVFNLGEKEVFLAISRDITERIRTEELLRKSEKLAVVGQLATAIAHEIRNPLTSIKGFMKLLERAVDKNNQWYVDVMKTEIEQIQVITNEFMTAAKTESVTVQPHDLNLLLRQVTLLLQSQAMMNNVYIKVEENSELPPIPCEANQIKQMFINILKNAIESMPNGGEVLVQMEQGNDDEIYIRFMDNGCGIPKDRIPFLGEPFYSTKEKGIGLGLMTCYKIAYSHQGKIFIESEEERGTMVEVIVPVSPIRDQGIHSAAYSEI